jgi:ribosomal protein S27E
VSLASLNPEPTNISYERHRPEQTLLYKLVQENLLSFYAQVEREHSSGLPDFVKKEFDEFLKCGVLAHGFLRARCDSCGHEKLVAFSCKRRGFCPSCGVRRMVESAAHLVDDVFPKKPLRQWVVTFPFQVRFLLAQDAKLMSSVLQVVNRVIESHLLKKAGFKREDGAKTGAVTFVQRFGSSLNLNIHFHIMYLDGVYCFEENKAKFQVTKPPTKAELEKVLSNISKRVVRLLERRGLIEAEPMPEEQSGFSHIQASSIAYRIALGKYKGQKALTLKTLPERDKTRNKYLAKNSGFSLHAGIACAAHERKKLDRICRYIARASLSEERLSTNKRGQVIYKLKKA